MASSQAAWGIDIGQCALKALRCTIDEDGKTIVADAFDYIEYPKILSQPEAEPDELIRDALQQFLSRNDLRGDKVAISVSGQAGLARFIKLPPVESKKIPDIVKYEAKQQIPFPLEEVIWDYQQLAGGSEEEGFTLETEVGLFAMKRDQVFKAIRPFDRADMELDVIQLAPLSIYNVVCHDFLKDLPPPDEYDPDDPPESVVVISLGTDTTDLVVTNGYRVWQRNIPLGGNHFTRALTKEMQLTFAKAEHLKRNAREAEDPKKVFQAMRPIFNDLVTEVQRSISYFQSIDRKAKIGNVIALGNAMRLPGLQQYLSKNLGYDVMEVKSYPLLTGKGVTSAPAFRENLLSYSVCYGLCLQGLNEAALSTNLLPRELVVQRTIREKKPWALATVALLLLGLAFNFFFLNRAWRSVNTERDDYTTAISQVTSVKTTYDTNKKTDEGLLEAARYREKLGEQVVDNSERRLYWPEVWTAINAALPINPELTRFPELAPNPKDAFGADEIPLAIQSLAEQRNKPFIPLDKRQDLHITKLESEFFPDLAAWYNTAVAEKYEAGQRAIAGIPEAEPAPPTDEENPAAEADVTGAAEEAPGGPTGDGWVIELQGFHDLAKADGHSRDAQYVRETILKNLENTLVLLPIGPGTDQMREFTMAQIGLTHPVLVMRSPKAVGEIISNPQFDQSLAGENDGIGIGGRPAVGARPAVDPDNPEKWTVERFFFKVQIAWSPNTVSQRIKRIDNPESLEATAGDVANNPTGGQAGSQQVAGGGL